MPRILTSSLADHHDAVWKQLIDAWEKLLAVKTYDEITLSEIASSAGMARNTLYNYAPDKASLLAAVAERTSEELLGQVTALAREADPADVRIDAIVSAVLKWIGAGVHRHIVSQTLFMAVPASVNVRASAPLLKANLFTKILKDGIRAGQLRAVGNVGLTIEMMAGVVERACRHVANAPDERAAIEREVIAFLRGALKPLPARRTKK